MRKISYPYHGKYGVLIHPFKNKLLTHGIKEFPLIKGEEILFNLMTEFLENSNLRENYSNGREMTKNFDKDKIIREWENIIN